MSENRFIEKNLRFNYSIGLVNGAIFGFVDALIAPSLTLALFITTLGGSSFLVGLLAAIYNGGWFLPQFLVSHRIQQLPVKVWLYRRASYIRIACWFLICVATFTLGESNPTLLLLIFFVLMTIYSFTAGFAGNAFMTVVAKIIPVQPRGSFFAWREFAGTAMGLFAGYVVAVALSPQRGLVFPDNFGLLFIAAFGAIGAGLLLFTLVRESREEIVKKNVSLGEQFRTARVIVRENHRFRRYLSTRFILAAGDLATPFYAIFAIRQLGAPESIVGLYIGLTTIAALIASPILSYMTGRHKLNLVMVIAAAATPIIPLVALVFSLLGTGEWVSVAFGIIFIVYGVGRTAANIAFPTYLLNLAPPETRSLYIGFTNTLLGVATFIPIVGGILLDAFGFTLLFLVTFVMSAIGFWLALGLRHSERPPVSVPNP